MKCLLAVHLHEGADALVAQGAAWAERIGATLDLLYVDEYDYDLALIDDPAVRTVLEPQWAAVRQRQSDRLAGLVAGLPEAVRGEGLVRHGRPAAEIAEAAEGYDLLLVATHGRKGIGHLLLGSVAERVIRTASVPTMVLRLEGAE